MTRLFASDFDGTMYFMREAEPLHAADLEAIARFRQAGGLFGVCTGRSLKGITLVLGERLHFDFYILVSGALVLDGDLRVLRRSKIDRALFSELYRRCAPLGEMIIQANDTVYCFGEPRPLQTPITSLDDIPGDAIYGLSLALGDEGEAARLCQALNADYFGRLVAFQNGSIVDTAPPGCSKGEALELLRARFPGAKIGGMGDSYNDLPLLRGADASYTFPTAPEPVRAAATGGLVSSLAEALARFAAD